MMVRARHALEAQGRRVVGGEMAITGLHRMRSKDVAAMSNQTRLSLLGSALTAHADWLCAADGTNVNSARQYTERHQRRLSERYGSVDVWSVEGSDVLLRYPSKSSYSRRVIVAREDEHASAATELARKACADASDRCVLLHAMPALAGHSSTAARTALARGDLATLRQCCGDAVAQQLLALPPAEVYVYVPLDSGPPHVAGASSGLAGRARQASGATAEQEVTAAALSERWRSMPAGAHPPVLAFYHDGGQHGALSNFFRAPFDFDLPPRCGAAALAAAGRPTAVRVQFAEAAIMLCKAAAMGDLPSYDRILAAQKPHDAKRLGRAVRPFDEARWDALVCGVACDVLSAKFGRGGPEMAAVLLGTGDRLLAEAAPKDNIWGIGVGTHDRRAQTPALWSGANVLGWALMKVRDKLRAAASPSGGIVGGGAVLGAGGGSGSEGGGVGGGGGGGGDARANAARAAEARLAAALSAEPRGVCTITSAGASSNNASPSEAKRLKSREGEGDMPDAGMR